MPDRAAVPLILGAGGRVGRTLRRRLEEEFPGTVSATRAEVDVTDRFRLEYEVERLEPRPTVVINCAGYTDVDGCESDPERAFRVNAEGAEYAARAAAGAGCRIVHLSTDCVFDGRSRTPYREDDAPAPLSVYGRTKLEGERRVAAVAEDHLIVRSSWHFGPAEDDAGENSGRAHFVDAILAAARRGGLLRVVSDQIGSPTYVADLAEALRRLLAIDFRGVVHFANGGACTRYDLAQEALRAAGIRGARLAPIATGEA
ncbi:MAG: dTDP-4-dehydrorhamnose reductase, partial [Acidobacteria bacterium]|nr:dTDP-4-dehydrorhamnose reductase [Acidobacteriota bacterium]